MTKKVIAFDLDDTLAPSKSQINDAMGDALRRLLEKYEVCIISGGKFEQFKLQVIDRLAASSEQLGRLHIMPTCGTSYYRYDDMTHEWKNIYSNDLTEEQKKRIISVLEKGAKKLGIWSEKTYGDIIEDRGSQVTWSALGQDVVEQLGEEGIRLKYEWDPDNRKKQALRDLIAPELPDVEVRVGGKTSVDITMIGVDKAYGIKKLIEQLEIGIDDVLFIGDMLEEGGNDYPVKAMGVDALQVPDYKTTPFVIDGILYVTG